MRIFFIDEFCDKAAQKGSAARRVRKSIFFIVCPIIVLYIAVYVYYSRLPSIEPKMVSRLTLS